MGNYWKWIAIVGNAIVTALIGIKEAVSDGEVKTVQVVHKTIEKIQIYSMEAVIALSIMAAVMVFFCIAFVYLKIKRNHKHTYTHRAETAMES